MTSLHPIAGTSAALVLTLALAGSAAADSLVLTNECLGDLSACTAPAEEAEASEPAPPPIEVAKRGPALGSESGPLTLSNKDLNGPPQGFEEPTPIVQSAPPLAEAPAPQPEQVAAVVPSAEATAPVGTDAAVAAESPEALPVAAEPRTRTVDDIPQRLIVADDETLAQIEAAEVSTAPDPIAPVGDAPIAEVAPNAETISAPIGEGAAGASDAGAEAWVFPNSDGTLASTTDDGSASKLDLGSCMERSIRAGNAYGESERVCKAVFPR